MSEKFIVRVLRHTKIENPDINNQETTSKYPQRKYLEDRVDQIFEQEFEKLDIGKFAVDLNRKDGQDKDEKSIKT